MNYSTSSKSNRVRNFDITSLVMQQRPLSVFSYNFDILQNTYKLEVYALTPLSVVYLSKRTTHINLLCFQRVSCPNSVFRSKLEIFGQERLRAVQ